MKNVQVTKIIIIYDKDDKPIKEIDVSDLPWKAIWLRATWALQTSLYGSHWTVISKPKE